MEVYYEPSLTETGVKYFLKETLKQCRVKKYNFYYKWINIVFFIIFLILLASLLTWKQKTKLTKGEQTEQRAKEKMYILEKIKGMSEQKQREENKIITDLPKFESDFVLLHKNYYKI